MPTTRADIERWLDEGKSRGASHVVVMCDTFDWSDYPVYVMPGQNPRDFGKTENMQKPMECYDLGLDIVDQLNEPRAHHWEPWRTGASGSTEPPTQNAE